MKKTRKKPNVSVITVCYNCESTIENTVKSVVNQTYPNVEYIIIDGKSTDRTIDIVKQFSKNIECIVSEKDDGIYSAMNKGIDICTGDYVIFLNSGDCFYNRTVIEIMVKKSNGQDIVYGDLILIHNNGTCRRSSQPPVINKFLYSVHVLLSYDFTVLLIDSMLMGEQIIKYIIMTRVFFHHVLSCSIS